MQEQGSAGESQGACPSPDAEPGLLQSQQIQSWATRHSVMWHLSTLRLKTDLSLCHLLSDESFNRSAVLLNDGRSSSH